MMTAAAIFLVVGASNVIIISGNQFYFIFYVIFRR